MDFSAVARSISLVAGIGLAGLLLVTGGCGKYPELSPAAYELTKTLDNVCALKNEGQLERLGEMVDQAAAEGQLSASDEKSLRKIMAIAQNGNWDEASKQVRRLRLDQNQQAPRGEPVRRKHPPGHDHDDHGHHH